MLMKFVDDINYRDQLIDLRTGMLLRGTQTGWRDGPAGTLQNSAGINTTPCAWEGRTLLQWWRLGSSCAGTALGCWQRAEQEPAPCHGSGNGQQHPGCCDTGCADRSRQEAEGGDDSSSNLIQKAPGSLGSFSMRKALICPEKGHHNGQEATAFLGGEAEGAGSVNPRQKKGLEERGI